MTHAETVAGGLVHLAKNHDHVRQHTGFIHLTVKLLAFTTAFANAAKQTYPFMVTDHVVDQFGEQDGFADAGPAEKARLAASLKRHQNIYDLDSRLKDLGFRGTPG